LKNLAAVKVLFNPDNSTIENLSSYFDQVDKIYVIDNSEATDKNIVDKIISIKNVEYISNQKNLGIAAALNIGAQKAIEDNYEFLLTMDQDSKASEGMIATLYNIVKNDEQIAIAAAEHFNPKIHKMDTEQKTYEVNYTMTSGNLLRLSAYKQAGGFLEKLFIDYVDHEYCLKLRSRDYKIIMTNKTYVYHTLGNSEKKKFLFWNIYPTHHSPLRLYYRTRNRFYVNRTYKNCFPDYVKDDFKNQLIEFIYLILGEKDLPGKIKMMIKGYSDYRKGNFGKYEHR
jgi:rhamnosyltransferase